MAKGFLVTVNDDLIRVVKTKSGRWSFTKIKKVADFSHFKELQEYVKKLDEMKGQSNG